MKKVLLSSLAAVLVATATAHAKGHVTQSPKVITRWFQLLPPLEYDKLYTGKLTIRRLETQQEIAKICGDADSKGCATHPSDDHTVCNLYIPNDEVLKKYHYSYAFVLRHELGHCNGWPGDHRNGRKTEIIEIKTIPALPKDAMILPTYPPVVCVTLDWKPEPCKNRNAPIVETKPSKKPS